jgi:hypothetical protein
MGPIEEKNKVAFFDFNGKTLFDYAGFSAMGNSMVTSKNYVRPRRDAIHDHKGMPKIKILE